MKRPTLNHIMGNEIDWKMTPQQTVTTVSTLSILVILYLAVIYHGLQNSYNFLYKQRRYKSILLTAFYTVSIATCVCRVGQYIYLVSFYFARNEQRTTEFLIFDMISEVLMLCVGCVMVLFNVSLTHAVQHATKDRQKVPSIALILFLSLSVILILPAVCMGVAYQYTYYVIAFFDLILATGLFMSLWYMLNAMSRVPSLANFEGKDMAKFFVRAFGISFIMATGLNFMKSFLWQNYREVIQKRPYWLSTISFLSDVLDQILPLVLMIVMHRKNFTEVAEQQDVAVPQLDQTLLDSDVNMTSASHITGLTPSLSMTESHSSGSLGIIQNSGLVRQKVFRLYCRHSILSKAKSEDQKGNAFEELIATGDLVKNKGNNYINEGHRSRSTNDSQELVKAGGMGLTEVTRISGENSRGSMRPSSRLLKIESSEIGAPDHAYKPLSPKLRFDSRRSAQEAEASSDQNLLDQTAKLGISEYSLNSC